MDTQVTPTPVETTPQDNAGYDPLGGAVNEKTYGIPKGSFTPDQLNQSIPEPSFTPPPQQADDQPFANMGKTEEKKKKEDKPFNPDMQDLPDSERTKAAEHMTDLLLNGYGRLHDVANSAVQISDRQIRKLQQKGELDPNVPIFYAPGQYVRLSEFVEEYNSQVADTIKLDPAFVEAVRPAMIRELAKRGMGLTDLQYLGFMFAQDGGYKTMTVLRMLRQSKDNINFLREQTALAHARPVQPKTQPMPTQAEPAASTPPPPPPMSERDNIEPEMTPEETGHNAADEVHSIQDHILSQHGKAGVFTPGGETPKFGGPAKIRQLNKQEKQANKVNKKKNATPAAEYVGMPIPDGKKRGRGRPKGVKNKPKNKFS